MCKLQDIETYFADGTDFEAEWIEKLFLSKEGAQTIAIYRNRWEEADPKDAQDVVVECWAALEAISSVTD